MEEEQGEESEIDGMDAWDSEDDGGNNPAGGEESKEEGKEK